MSVDSRPIFFKCSSIEKRAPSGVCESVRSQTRVKAHQKINPYFGRHEDTPIVTGLAVGNSKVCEEFFFRDRDKVCERLDLWLGFHNLVPRSNSRSVARWPPSTQSMLSPDRAFVGVGVGCVDRPVPEGERCMDSCGGPWIVLLEFVSSHSHSWHQNAVVKFRAKNRHDESDWLIAYL